MTTKVKIENVDGNHPVSVTKVELYDDTRPSGVVHARNTEEATLSTGQSVEWYIWGEQYITVREV